ncbi:MAG TPA: acetate--CoA ligase family protein [Nocardioidaceae bacterium]|nr:acetate--CoA ligase family protein [Nocardioidaceae bacterium]
MSAAAAREPRAAVRTMLEARRVAVVGASARPGSFGGRMVTELLRSTAPLDVHLVNPRYESVAGRPCVPSLLEVPGPVDLVLLGVGDDLLEGQLRTAAKRGDRAAVVFGNAYEPPRPGEPSLRERLAAIAAEASMALCGAGCMGFANVGYGLRALGYVERDPLPPGPVALVTHSGSVFSALLRTRRPLGFTLAVSSGQELVTTAADYLSYAVESDETGAVALVMEAIREPDSFRAALARAAQRDLPVVLLPVGTSETGRAMVSAHSGAVAGGRGAWEALADAYGVHLVGDLGELVDTLELFTVGRRVPRARRAGGLAAVLDSGAERALLSDVAAEVGAPFAALSGPTLAALGAGLDPGLVAANPLDVWGTGADTEQTFRDMLATMAADPAVGAVLLAVDLVEEYDGDRSYLEAALATARATDAPVVVLSHLPDALDQAAAAQLRAAGVPVLAGTRSGLRALTHLLAHARGRPTGPPLTATVDRERQARWATRLAGRPLPAEGTYELAADYGLSVVAVRAVSSSAEAQAAAEALGYPVVLKTAGPVAHKTEVGGVVLGVADRAGVAAAYDGLAARLGRRVLVCQQAGPGVEVLVGVVRDPSLGPLVVVGAGGTLVERFADRAVAIPPLTAVTAQHLLERSRVRDLLAHPRGLPPADAESVVSAVLAVSRLASELGGHLSSFEVNPLVCTSSGAVGVDVLVES